MRMLVNRYAGHDAPLSVAAWHPSASLRTFPYSHSIINSFCKSLYDLILGSQRLSFTVILTVILTGIPNCSIHHQSTSIEDSWYFHDGPLSRSIAVYRFFACDF